MKNKNDQLGTIEASEQLIQDLYVDLRRKIKRWASITHQTAQARMGYVGQHLVSVVTGYPGGRSGARGKDLILPNGQFAEIKTCYRVDQLGFCKDCDARMASLDKECPNCRSKNTQRNDDSKWLIGIRNETELSEILDPVYYFLVLFDFVAIRTEDTTIRASIWRIDTLAPGFALCMVDYYFNIRQKSISKAPFNLWPFQLKFDLMRPVLIYQSFIQSDDTIKTTIFPGRDKEEFHPLLDLVKYSASKNLDENKLVLLANKMGIRIPAEPTKKTLLKVIQEDFEKKKMGHPRRADILATALYHRGMEQHRGSLPPDLQTRLSKVPLW